jgi:5'-deoxy-5'-methylthioadenosine phosphorylase
VKLAIIGGSLLKQLDNFSVGNDERVRTPFGEPSENFLSGNVDGLEVVFFNRHGVSHHIAPHQINYKANMFALKILEVTHIVAVTAVGGITQRMSPMKWAVPDQLIDYTHGRIQTYNDGNDDEVQHIDFSYPFDDMLCHKLTRSLEMESCEFEADGTYGVTQGPRLETVAEIKRMQHDGCDIVGMTAMPEASLARELEINYAQLSLVVNWAAGAGPVLPDGAGPSQKHEIISMDEIRSRISAGNNVCERLVSRLISQLVSDAG